MTTTRRRRSYEAGHKPKWLVVIDDTEECDRAVYFAARRASRVGAGVIMLRVIDTSPHDRAMRQFHNWMKDTPAFRDSAEDARQISFAPFQAWMVMTDGVSHACIRGRHALVDTFLVPLANCHCREEAPYWVLHGARA